MASPLELRRRILLGLALQKNLWTYGDKETSGGSIIQDVDLPSGKYKLIASVQSSYTGDCLVRFVSAGNYAESGLMIQSTSGETHELIFNCVNPIRQIALYSAKNFPISANNSATWSNIELIRIGNWDNTVQEWIDI